MSSIPGWVERVWPLAVPLSLVLITAALASRTSETTQLQAVAMLINMVVVVGLYLFVGNSGILSFGHIGFMLIAAYATALMTIPPLMKDTLLPNLPSFIARLDVDPVAALLVSALLSMCFAGFLSLVLMRLSGLTMSIAMFAVLLILNQVAKNWDDVTRGTNTMLGVPKTVGLGVATLVALLSIVVAFVFQNSKTGLRLRASREDEPAAAAIGINVRHVRRVALVLSALLVGVAGAEYAQFFSSFNPDAFFLDITFLTIAMLVVGGIRSLLGAVIGTILISVLLEFLREAEAGITVGRWMITAPVGLRQVGLAAVLLLILKFRPAGLSAGREARLPARVTDGADA